MREVVLAEEEYRKHPDLKKEEVQELAEWIKQQPEIPPTSEEMVMRFLFSCYFDMETAKKCAKYYYSVRFSNPILFLLRDIHLDELQAQMKTVQNGIIPVKDPNDYIVLVHRLQVFDSSKYVFAHSCRLFFMVTDAILNREGNPTGFIIVFDMQGVTLSHVLRMKLSQVKSAMCYVQDGLPIRLKAIHVVNASYLANKIMFLLRPFMKKELFDLVHFHSGNHEEGIQKFLPKECLPSDYGGHQASVNELNDDYSKWMLECREKFVEEDNELNHFLESRSREKSSH